MTGTIFDLISDDSQEAEKPLEGKEGFFEVAKHAPMAKDDSFWNNVQDYGKTILKGTAEGLSRFGKILGPLQSYEGKTKEQEFEHQTETLDKLLPTDENYTQKSLRRGLKEAPSMLAFPGSTLATLPRSISAGFIGEGAKELGAPEWAQSALELTAYVGPDVMKKLLETGNKKEIIEWAKKMGMTDEQITPLIQSEFKQKWLTKLSPKRGSTQEALKNTKSALDNTYSTLQNSEFAKKEISEVQNGKLINGIKKFLSGMPREVQDKIEKDLADLLNNKITGETLINFWKDLNKSLSGSTKELALLKTPVREALQSISPELSKDFEMLNSLYTKFYPISARLKPTLTSDIISAAESIGLLSGGVLGMMYGNYGSLLALAGEKGAKKIAQQMLINPRFQQIPEKMNAAFQQNKYGLAKKLIEDFQREISRIDPVLGKKIPSLSEKEFEQLLNVQQKKVE